MIFRQLDLCPYNQGSIANIMNDKNHRQTKHIDIKFHFVKEKMKSRQVVFQYTPSAENVADIFPKPLVWDTLRKLISYLGLTFQTESDVTVQGKCWNAED